MCHFLLFLHVQTKNQPTITDVALSHNKVECPYIRWNTEAWSPELEDSHRHNCFLWGYIKEFQAQMQCSYEQLLQQINTSAEVVILHLQNEYELKSVIGYVSFQRRDKCKNLLTTSWFYLRLHTVLTMQHEFGDICMLVIFFPPTQ